MKDGTRLNKYLATCAMGSRRHCDELIQAGRVEVNGQPCLNMGTRIGPGDHVRVGGLWLGDLEPGRWAVLNRKEIAMLLEPVAPRVPAGPGAKTPRKRPG